MNTMDSSSFYDDDPAFASLLDNTPPLLTPEPLEIDNIHSPPTAATRDDHIKPNISNWAYVRINLERFVPASEVAPRGQICLSEVVDGKV